MLPFTYQKPTGIDRAQAAVASSGPSSGQPTRANGQFIAGGTNMTDYMKLGVSRPDALVDLNGIETEEMRCIDVAADHIRLGSLVRMSMAEDHPGIRAKAPMLSDSLSLAASRQIRNMASLGGNVLQRTRCEYFRDVAWACNRRNPGSGCSAIGGVNRQHAVLGGSDACIATYHGDFAQALIALDAAVDIRGPAGKRRIAFSDLHRLPGDTPEIETVLRADEIIVALLVPIERWSARSRYLKVRDRQSYAFALAAAAVALDLDGDTVRQARIALGGLATIPWRAREAEDMLKDKPLTEEIAEKAAKAAFSTAKAQDHNGFKLELGRQTLVRALFEVKAMKV